MRGGSKVEHLAACTHLARRRAAGGRAARTTTDCITATAPLSEWVALQEGEFALQATREWFRASSDIAIKLISNLVHLGAWHEQ